MYSPKEINLIFQGIVTMFDEMTDICTNHHRLKQTMLSKSLKTAPIIPKLKETRKKRKTEKKEKKKKNLL